MYMYIRMYIYIYIYVHLMYKGEPGPGALWVASFLHGAGTPLLKSCVAPWFGLASRCPPSSGEPSRAATSCRGLSGGDPIADPEFLITMYRVHYKAIHIYVYIYMVLYICICICWYMYINVLSRLEVPIGPLSSARIRQIKMIHIYREINKIADMVILVFTVFFLEE